MRTTIAIALAAAVLAAACERTDSKRTDVVGTSGALTTVSGCLTSDTQGRYVLTAKPSDMASTGARATGEPVSTYAYQLVGGSGIEAHVGKNVEVTGHVSSKEADLEVKNKTSAEPAPAQPGLEPKVESKERIDLEVRELHVQSVRSLGSTCTGS